MTQLTYSAYSRKALNPIKPTKRALLGLMLAFTSFMMLIIELNSIGTYGEAKSLIQIFGFSLFIGYCYSFYSESHTFISTSFYQLFYYLGMMLSAIMIGFGAHMYEIKGDGNSNGLFWITLFFATTGFEAAYLGYITSSKKTAARPIHSLNRLFIRTAVYATLLGSFLILAIYGSPLSYEVTRVSYWGLVAPSYLSPIRILVITTFFLATAEYFIRKNKQKDTTVQKIKILSYVFISLILLGEKFTVAIFFLFIWLTIQSSFSPKESTTKTYVHVFFVLILAMAYVGYTYSRMGLGPEFVFARLALQGQVLWSVLNESLTTLSWGATLDCNIDCLSSFDGRDFVAQRYLPPTTYELNQETGTSLSGFMPSIQILTFGIPIAILIHLVFSFFLGRIQFVLSNMISGMDIIGAFLYFVVYFFALGFWYVGNINTVKLIFFSYLILLFYKFIRIIYFRIQRERLHVQR